MKSIRGLTVLEEHVNLMSEPTIGFPSSHRLNIETGEILRFCWEEEWTACLTVLQRIVWQA
jgi:hypothetical protein